MQLGRIARILGWALLALAAAQTLPLVAALSSSPALISGLLAATMFTGALGGLLLFAFEGIEDSRSRRTALATPVIAFSLLPVAAALPMVMTATAGPGAALFMAVSAFTTTAAALHAPEELSQPILLWRAEIAWIGGYATLLSVGAILSVLNIGGMRLSQTAIIKGESGRLTSTLRNVAAPTAWVYGLLTGAVFIIAWWAGNDPFLALLCALQSVSTAGYALPDMPPALGPVRVLAAIVAASNLTLLWRVFDEPGRRRWARDPELRGYILLLVSGALVFALVLDQPMTGWAGLPDALWQGLRHAAGSITTTGLDQISPERLGPGAALLAAALALAGGCTGSTAGGLRVMRAMILFQQANAELQRLAHPKRVFRLRYAGAVLDRDRDLGGVWQALLAVLVAFGAGSLILSFTGLSYRETVAVSIAALSTAGPVAFAIDPAWDGYAALTNLQRATVMILMIGGRVEPALFAAFFVRRYWKA